MVLVHKGRIVGLRRIECPSGISIRILIGHPPAADLNGIPRIDDIEDPVYHSFKPDSVGGEMNISAAVIHESVNAVRVGHAIIPVAEKFGIFWVILNVIDS